MTSFARALAAAGVLGVAGIAPAAPAQAPADPFTRVELPHGGRALILTVDGAERQSFLAFLPLDLHHDGPHCAQFAHLLEHLLIRSTDPDSLSAEGLELNGETGGGFLRLDAYAAPSRWREALDRQRRWLAARDFDAAVLEREKGRIAGELATTVPRGATHKWASAAWSQAIAHGLEHAAVHGDAQAVTAAQAEAYARARLDGAGGITLLAVGPIAAEEIAAALRETFGAASPGPPPPPAAAPSPAAHHATWDLDARHFLAWTPLPADDPATRLAAYLLVQRVNQAFFAAGEDAPAGGGRAYAALEDLPGYGRSLVISIALAAGAELDAVRQSLDDALAATLAGRGVPATSMAIFQLRLQTRGLPDFAALRRQADARGQSGLVETQAVLNLFMLERTLGMSLPEIAAALATLDPQQADRAAAPLLDPARRSTLELGPLQPLNR